MIRSRIIVADVLDGLSQIESESVQCVVTSPPYWGLRDYGVPGQIGLEPTPQEHITKMVEVFREVRRVLRRDGTVWLNYGDCYNGTGAATDACFKGKQGTSAGTFGMKAKSATTLKPKDLCMMPHRLAIALQDDGWWVRSDIVWAKPNPMPESVTDRPTRSHEYVFLLAKSERYYFDSEAVRENKAPVTVSDPRMNGNGHRRDRDYPGSASNGGTNLGGPEGGRNIRTVWTIPTEPYADAHFATFPTALVKPCVLAGTSEKGCCAECGAPWVRVVEKEDKPNAWKSSNPGQMTHGKQFHKDHGEGAKRTETLGWRPSCSHDAPTIPCVVLDPFMGSGTVGLVSLNYGRRFVGIELNESYAKMAEKRIHAARSQELLAF